MATFVSRCPQAASLPGLGLIKVGAPPVLWPCESFLILLLLPGCHSYKGEALSALERGFQPQDLSCVGRGVAAASLTLGLLLCACGLWSTVMEI